MIQGIEIKVTDVGKAKELLSHLREWFNMTEGHINWQTTKNIELFLDILSKKIIMAETPKTAGPTTVYHDHLWKTIYNSKSPEKVEEVEPPKTTGPTTASEAWADIPSSTRIHSIVARIRDLEYDVKAALKVQGVFREEINQMKEQFNNWGESPKSAIQVKLEEEEHKKRVLTEEIQARLIHLDETVALLMRAHNDRAEELEALTDRASCFNVMPHSHHDLAERIARLEKRDHDRLTGRTTAS
jgi:hypothetical protein